MPAAPHRIRNGLADRLDEALRGDVAVFDSLACASPRDERDELQTLLAIHDLHLAPVDKLGGAERFQHHPQIAALKWRLEETLVDRLDAAATRAKRSLPDDAVTAVRSVATRSRVPAVYDWLATDASPSEVVAFLSLEGGPDGGFDDLVALCQVGMNGEPKLEMARNYWDEMGQGSAAGVHTELHRQLSRALGLVAVPRRDQPIGALQRSALGSLLATNRHLQPEMVGALGIIELLAGPRCRRVVQALRRIGAPADAFPFYTEHAEVDPRHGKDWVDHVVTPLANQNERWAAGIVRGARWRAAVDARFFAEVGALFVPAAPANSAKAEHRHALAS